MKIRFFNEARWQLVQSKSGNPKAINAANPNAKPLYGQEALDAANRQPRQPKAEAAPAPRQRDSEPRKAILKPPPSIPAPPKAIAKATTSGQAEVITPKGTEDTPRQSPTATKAFKNWFGDWQGPHTAKVGGVLKRIVSAVVDKITGRPKQTFPVAPSKVTDESGAPKVVYHGTSHDFDTFTNKGDPKNSLSTMYGPGFYFTEDKGVANSYAQGSSRTFGKAAQIHPVYLNIRNPFDADAYIRNVATNKGMARLPHGILTDILGGSDKANDYLEKLGYDGITHMGGDVTGGNKHRVWIAFRPNQIKHAEANKGTFDPNNPNMYFSENA